MPLITLQDRLGDVFRVAQGSLLAPSNKSTQRGSARSHGIFRVPRNLHPVEVRIHISGERQMSERVDAISIRRTGGLRPCGLARFKALAFSRHGLLQARSG